MESYKALHSTVKTEDTRKQYKAMINIVRKVNEQGEKLSAKSNSTLKSFILAAHSLRLQRTVSFWRVCGRIPQIYTRPSKILLVKEHAKHSILIVSGNALKWYKVRSCKHVLPQV